MINATETPITDEELEKLGFQSKHKSFGTKHWLGDFIIREPDLFDEEYNDIEGEPLYWYGDIQVKTVEQLKELLEKHDKPSTNI